MNLTILADLRGVVLQVEHAGTPTLEQGVPASKGYECSKSIVLHIPEHPEHPEHRIIAKTDKTSANEWLEGTAESIIPSENVQPDANVEATQHPFPQGAPEDRQQILPESNMKPVWPPDVQSLVDWFMIQKPPSEPFLLEPHLLVVGPGKFFESLRREIETGPRGPRARMGTLQWDLRNLKAYLN